MDTLAKRLGGTRQLQQCNGRMVWPERGVYFFYESGEERSDSGFGQRITRVGTHAVSTGSKTSLWDRLRSHRGRADGLGGDHRGSIFRLLVGQSYTTRYGCALSSWGLENSLKKAAARFRLAPEAVRQNEAPIEQKVSEHIGSMPFLWLAIEDEPSACSMRAYIEKHSISLLSNHGKAPLDSPSTSWLGNYCTKVTVSGSGLWNSDYVDNRYDPVFLDVLSELVESQEP